MNGKGPGKKKRTKKGAGAEGRRAAAGGLLSRLFGGDAKAAPKKSKAKPGADGAAKARPLTPLERSIQEIKHMTKVGKSDPERLAMILSKLLQQEKQKQEQAQQDFDRMVWDIVNTDESETEDGAGGDESGDPPP